MKKKILGGIAMLAIVTTKALNVNFSAKNNNLLDVSLANVEALARGEEEDCSDGEARLCCKIWNIKYNGSAECNTGGVYKCTYC